MQIIRTVAQLEQFVAEAKNQGKTIGLVPTMGALHRGHMSLVERARGENDLVVVSVFVNPTQFNNKTDLALYPRTEEKDCQMLQEAGVDVAFVPTVEEIYPQEDTRVFDLGPVAEVMEGAKRPGHFNGVAQIVSKLFEMTRPDRAYFGEKDFQQIAVIRKMVELCGFDLEIVPCPICRESSGLALSSRNQRLTPEQVDLIAPHIFHSLRLAKRKMVEEGASLSQVCEAVTSFLKDVPQTQVEYFQMVDAKTMQPVSSWDDAEHIQGCITAYVGDVRLIDNLNYK